MSGISINDGFSVGAKVPIDSRFFFDTIADMKSYPETLIPSTYFCACEGSLYIYNDTNTEDSSTGKWRLFTGENASSVDISLWQENYDYDVGDIVKTQDNKLIQCITAHTSGTDLDETELENWIYVLNEYYYISKENYNKLITDGIIDDNTTNIYIVDDGLTNGSIEQFVNQVTSFPTATANNVGTIYQYVGESNDNYTNGYFYKSVLNSDTNLYEWEAIEIQSSSIFIDDGDTLSSSKTWSNVKINSKLTKSIDIDSDTKILTVTRNDETTLTYDLSTLIKNITTSLNYGQAKYCTAKPTCSKVNNDWIVTFVDKSDNTQKTCNALNTWFYYEVTDNDTTITVQTLFIDGQELSINTKDIDDILRIDSDTKHWILYGQDTGLLAYGYTPKIQQNEENSSSVFKLDITNYSEDGTATTVTTENLHGADGVIAPNEGMYGFRVVDGNLHLYLNVPDDTIDSDSVAPPLELRKSDGCLHYIVGGTIQYDSKTET